MEIEIQPRLPAFNATQHKVFDGIKTDRAHLQRILDGGMQHILFIVFKQAENLHVLTLPSLALSRFQQSLQR